MERTLNAAHWFSQNSDAMNTVKGLQDAPHVTRRDSSDRSSSRSERRGPTPVVVNQGSLRVASRVFGLPLPQGRPGSDGRLAITRLLGGSTTRRPDNSRMAMAGVLEIAASLCRSRDPQCGACPLATYCAWATGSASD